MRFWIESLCVLALVLLMCVPTTAPAIIIGVAPVESEEGRLAIDGGETIAYKRIGRGASTVLVAGSLEVARAHGTLGTSRTLVFFVRENERGLADDSPEHDAIAFETMRRHVAAERVSLVVASSRACGAALYAKRYPKRVERIVVVGAVEPCVSFEEVTVPVLALTDTTGPAPTSARVRVARFGALGDGRLDALPRAALVAIDRFLEGKSPVRARRHHTANRDIVAARSRHAWTPRANHGAEIDALVATGPKPVPPEALELPRRIEPLARPRIVAILGDFATTVPTPRFETVRVRKVRSFAVATTTETQSVKRRCAEREAEARRLERLERHAERAADRAAERARRHREREMDAHVDFGVDEEGGH